MTLTYKLMRTGNPADKIKAANIVGSMALATWALSQTGIDFSRESPISTILSHPAIAVPYEAVRRGVGYIPGVHRAIEETVPDWLKQVYGQLVEPGMRGADTDVLALKTAGQTLRSIGQLLSTYITGDVAGREDAYRNIVGLWRVALPAGTEIGRVWKFATALAKDWNIIDEAGKKSYRMGEITEDPTLATGKPAMIGWFGKYLPGGILYQLTGGKVPGEAVRTLIGSTTEQQARYSKHEAYTKEQADYKDLRSAALNNYMKYLDTGDSKYYESFSKAQQKLISKGGNPITKADVRRQLQERQLTALQRHRRVLPKGYETE